MANDAGCIKETFRIFRRRPFLYFAAALTPTVVMFLSLILEMVAMTLGLDIQVFIHTHTFHPPPDSSTPPWVVSGFVAVLLFIGLVVVTAAASGIALLTWEECEGRTLSALGLAAAVGRRLFPLIALVLIIGFGVLAGASLFVPLILHLGGGVAAGVLLFIPLVLLLLAPAAFAVPAAIIEKLGPLRALKRSFRLARGRIFKIAGIFLVFDLAMLSFNHVLFLMSHSSRTAHPFARLFIFIVGFTPYMFLFILLTLLYRKARSEKEAAQAAAQEVSIASDPAFLKESFRLFRRRPVLDFTTAIMPSVAMLLILLLTTLANLLGFWTLAHIHAFHPPSDYSVDAWMGEGLVVLFFFLLTAAASGVALLTWEECEGRTLSALGLAAAVGRRLFPLIALVLILALGVAAGALLFIPLIRDLGGGVPAGVLLFIPLVLLLLAPAAFAVPAAIIEKLGPLRALKRSFRLTRGHIFKIMAIFLAAAVTYVVVEVLFILLLRLVSPVSRLRQHILIILFMCIFAALISIPLTLLYRKARTEQEASQSTA